MKRSKTRLLVSVAVVAVAVIIVHFLVQDIYNLQKEYDEIIADIYGIRGIGPKESLMINRALDEIEAAKIQRIIGFPAVAIMTVTGLFFLNKRELKRKEVNIAVLTVALIITCFLVQDIYRLQKDRDNIMWYLSGIRNPSDETLLWVEEKLAPVEAAKTHRFIGLSAVAIATVAALFFLNKRKPFKEKHAVKPELTTLEACSPPSPKGRAEREEK